MLKNGLTVEKRILCENSKPKDFINDLTKKMLDTEVKWFYFIESDLSTFLLKTDCVEFIEFIIQERIYNSRKQ